jgi:hypothetical protein
MDLGLDPALSENAVNERDDGFAIAASELFRLA